MSFLSDSFSGAIGCQRRDGLLDSSQDCAWKLAGTEVQGVNKRTEFDVSGKTSKWCIIIVNTVSHSSLLKICTGGFYSVEWSLLNCLVNIFLFVCGRFHQSSKLIIAIKRKAKTADVYVYDLLTDGKEFGDLHHEFLETCRKIYIVSVLVKR